MDYLPFELTGPIGSAATLGLIVLKFDETLEQDFRRIFPGRDVAVYVSRIPSDAKVTPETLTAMEADIATAAGLFPPAAPFGAVGYGCTSASTLIGAERVAELVRQGVTAGMVTNPLSAALAGCDALGVRRIGMVTPYIESVSLPVRRAFEAHGVDVARLVSFGEAGEERVTRIDGPSVIAAALDVGRAEDVEAVFLSCTNLRTLEVIDAIEAELGKPVISSNLALAWHMAQAAGAPVAEDAPGRIWAI